jgi:hypothetical protein
MNCLIALTTRKMFKRNIEFCGSFLQILINVFVMSKKKRCLFNIFLTVNKGNMKLPWGIVLFVGYLTTI